MPPGTEDAGAIGTAGPNGKERHSRGPERYIRPSAKSRENFRNFPPHAQPKIAFVFFAQGKLRAPNAPHPLKHWTALVHKLILGTEKPVKFLHTAGRHLLAILLTALIGGLAGATLVRIAPGFGIQESDLNLQLSSEMRRSLHQQDAAERNILSYYGHYLSSLAKGDLGYSRSMDRPVSELLRDRLPETLQSIAIGVAGGWLLGLALALPATWKRSPLYSTTASVISGIFVCIPSAVLALLFLVVGSPGTLAIALVVLPKVFRFSRNLLIKTYALPHVLTAKARGLAPARILGFHVLPNIAGPLLALAGVTVSIAIGAAIPVEVVCDSPGLGQLAWKAALSRDVPLLVNLTLMIALATVAANSFSDALTPTATRDVL